MFVGCHLDPPPHIHNQCSSSLLWWIPRLDYVSKNSLKTGSLKSEEAYSIIHGQGTHKTVSTKQARLDNIEKHIGLVPQREGPYQVISRQVRPVVSVYQTWMTMQGGLMGSFTTGSHKYNLFHVHLIGLQCILVWKSTVRWPILSQLCNIHGIKLPYLYVLTSSRYVAAVYEWVGSGELLIAYSSITWILEHQTPYK